METLKAHWDKCIAMWVWVCNELPDDWTPKSHHSIRWYKHQYTILHGGEMCHFCGYNAEFSDDSPVDSCDACPGRLVDPTFSCFDSEYHYEKNPHEFLTKLKELYPYDCTWK